MYDYGCYIFGFVLKKCSYISTLVIFGLFFGSFIMYFDKMNANPPLSPSHSLWNPSQLFSSYFHLFIFKNQSTMLNYIALNVHGCGVIDCAEFMKSYISKN